jgi:hypothetical protein
MQVTSLRIARQLAGMGSGNQQHEIYCRFIPGCVPWDSGFFAQKPLADGLEKLEANQVNIAGLLLSLDPSLDRRHTGRHKGGRRYRGGWDRERDNFIDRKRTGAGDERPYRADIQGFGQLEEPFATGIVATDE